MPFLELQSRYHATSHFRSGICESSKIVPTVTVNCLSQTEQWYRPARIFFSGFALIFQISFGVAVLQCGQTTPCPQRISSKYRRADSSVEKRDAISSSVKS